MVGALAIGLAYATAFLPAPASAGAPWLMISGIALLLLSLILLATRRSGRGRPLEFWLGMGFLFLVLAVGFGGALLLSPEVAGARLLLGLPRRSALLVYGIGVVPALVLPLVYALSFEATVLSEADLRELRARLATLAAQRSNPAE